MSGTRTIKNDVDSFTIYQSGRFIISHAEPKLFCADEVSNNAMSVLREIFMMKGIVNVHDKLTQN
jgi:hypothetical protein